MEGREGPRGAPGLGEVGEKVEALAPVEPEAPGDRAAVVSLIMVGFATQRSGPPVQVENPHVLPQSGEHFACAAISHYFGVTQSTIRRVVRLSDGVSLTALNLVPGDSEVRTFAVGMRTEDAGTSAIGRLRFSRMASALRWEMEVMASRCGRSMFQLVRT